MMKKLVFDQGFITQGHGLLDAKSFHIWLHLLLGVSRFFCTSFDPPRIVLGIVLGNESNLDQMGLGYLG